MVNLTNLQNTGGDGDFRAQNVWDCFVMAGVSQHLQHLFQSTNRRVWNVEAYVNGVIWPSATHGTTTTKGEVVLGVLLLVHLCTGVLVYQWYSTTNSCLDKRSIQCKLHCNAATASILYLHPMTILKMHSSLMYSVHLEAGCLVYH